MSKIQKTEEELRDELSDQVRFLVKSCFDFDHGELTEAKRMSVTLRNLLKETKHCKSLLGLTEPSIQLVSYVENHDPGDGTIWIQRNFVTGMLMGNPFHFYSPAFASPIAKKYQLPVSNWLDEVIITDMAGNQFSRQRIILTLAEQDGGAHVDPSVEADYHALTRSNSQQNFMMIGNFEDGLPAQLPPEALKPAPTPVWHAIRHISHEVLESLGVKYHYDPFICYQGLSLGGFGLG